MTSSPQALLSALIILVSGCSASPWSSTELGDPQEQAALSNGMVVSLGSGSFTTASTLLDLSAKARWPEAVPLTQTQAESEMKLKEASPMWEEAKISVHETSLIASAVGLELVVEMSLQPMSLFSPEDSEKTCPEHVAFDHGLWRLPIRLTRSKLGSVQAASESHGELTAELIVSDTATCPEREDADGAEEMNYEALFDDLALAMVEVFNPWLSEEIPTALGLDLATTSPVSAVDETGDGSVLIDIRTSLADEVTWWHWSDEQLIVGFDTRVLSSVNACVPDTTPSSIPAAPIPATSGERMWLLHTGTLNATLEGLWRNGDLCMDRPSAASWSVASWTDQWPALSALDPETDLQMRLWPSQPPRADFESVGDGVEITLGTQEWTLELYGRFHGADVRLTTLDLDMNLRADLEIGSERAIWLSKQTVEVQRIESTDGLFSSPPESVVGALLDGWVELMTSSVPIAWIPPTPQPADVSVELRDSYLVFTATH